jgi:O-succinylbenzoate synthase
MSEKLFQTMRVIALPTKTNFRGIKVREVALFEGEQGWGEFSPFLEYSPQECLPWLKSAVEAATKPRPKFYRRSISVNATMPALHDKDQIESILNNFPGCDVVKVKVGDNLQEDLDRISYIKDLQPEIKLRVDVNGAWSVDQALQSLNEFVRNFGPLEYVEQPCATLDELRALKSRLKLDVPIVVDEIIRKAKNPFDVDLTGAADILMLKVQPLGGIERSLKIAAHHELPVVVSSALESAVGISYGLELAAAIKELDYSCGLATGALLGSDVSQIPITDGFMSLCDFEPDFEPHLVSPERHQWWQDRVMKTWELNR